MLWNVHVDPKMSQRSVQGRSAAVCSLSMGTTITTVLRGVVFLLVMLAVLEPPVLAGRKTSQAICKPDEIDHRYVHCAKLNLTSVPTNLLESTTKLYLNHNSVDLSKKMYHFSKYTNLKELTLVNNSIKSIHSRSFLKVDSLELLDLSGNLLQEVPTEALKQLISLQILYLDGNKIHRIEKYAFRNLSKLVELRLSGNNLIYVDGLSLFGLNHLKSLEIQHNSLNSFPSTLFQSCKNSLEEILLYDNPWECDCRIRWLRDYLMTKNMTWPSKRKEPRCDLPILRRNRTFFSVLSELFACKLVMDSSGTMLNMKMHENITLTCKVQSNPPAKISWLFKGKKIFNITDEYTIKELGDVNGKSMLIIRGFDIDDIGSYECLAENPISTDSIVYTLTIEGIDPFENQSLVAVKPDNKDSRTVHVVVLTVCITAGLISICIVTVLVFYYWKRFTRLQKEKHEELKLKIKNHFESNGNYKTETDNNKNPPSEQMDNEETDPLYTTLKAPLEKHDPLYGRIPQIPNGIPNGILYEQFRTDRLDSEVYAPSTVMTNLDSQSDSNGVFWTEASRNDNSSNPSELACPLLDTPAGYTPNSSYWDPNGEVFHTPYYSPYPRGPESFNSIHSLRPYNHDSLSHPPLFSSNPSAMFMNPHNWSFSTVPVPPRSGDDCNKRSASVGSLGHLPIPPKKPPRLYSYSSVTNSETGGKLSLPQPGSVDEFGTAV